MMSWFLKPAPVTAANPAGKRVSKSRLTGALLASAITVTGGYEGLRLSSYQDVVKVWTACYGETLKIKPGMRFTKPECDAMFAGRLVEFETGMRSCLVAPDAIPDKPYLAFVDITYNIGVGAWCKSSMVRKLNSGDLRGACDSLLAWNKAGGRVIPGLTRRRQEERKLCLEGVQ